jgi:hypothetical protein
MVWQAGGAGRRWHRNQGLFARVRILNLRTFNVAYTHYNTHIAHSTQHTQCTLRTQHTAHTVHTSHTAHSTHSAHFAHSTQCTLRTQHTVHTSHTAHSAHFAHSTLRTQHTAHSTHSAHRRHSAHLFTATPVSLHCHSLRDTTLSQECSTFTRHNPISRVFHPLTAGHHTNTQTRERADYIRALDADGRLSAAVSWTRLEHPTWWHRRVLRVRADEQAGAPGESVVLLATCIFVSTVTLTHLP